VKKALGAYFSRGAYAAVAIIVSPLGALGNRDIEKGTWGLLFTRGLRRSRYYCVALRGFKVSQPSKPSQLSQPSIPAKPYFFFICLFNMKCI
jgi:hypothetical protein